MSIVYNQDKFHIAKGPNVVENIEYVMHYLGWNHTDKIFLICADAGAGDECYSYNIETQTFILHQKIKEEKSCSFTFDDVEKTYEIRSWIERHGLIYK